MDDLGHSWTAFYICRVCGIAQHEANIGGIRCTAAEEECDEPVIVSEGKP